MLRILTRLEPDPDRQALYYFDVVTGSILGRE
jgi:hypothetical protein